MKNKFVLFTLIASIAPGIAAMTAEQSAQVREQIDRQKQKIEQMQRKCEADKKGPMGQVLCKSLITAEKAQLRILRGIQQGKTPQEAAREEIEKAKAKVVKQTKKAVKKLKEIKVGPGGYPKEGFVSGVASPENMSVGPGGYPKEEFVPSVTPPGMKVGPGGYPIPKDGFIPNVGPGGYPTK